MSCSPGAGSGCRHAAAGRCCCAGHKQPRQSDECSAKVSDSCETIPGSYSKKVVVVVVNDDDSQKYHHSQRKWFQGAVSQGQEGRGDQGRQDE